MSRGLHRLGARHEPAPLPDHAAGGRHHLRAAAGRMSVPALVGAAGCWWRGTLTGRTFTPDEDRLILDDRAASLSWPAIGAWRGTTLVGAVLPDAQSVTAAPLNMLNQAVG